MKTTFLSRFVSFALAAALFLTSQAKTGRADVPIVVSSQATPVERAAAEDLARCLRRIYPREQFAVGQQMPAAGNCIVLGTAADPRLDNLVDRAKLAGADSYVVTTSTDGPRRLGVIAGADPRGVAYGVYALLEKLGCGFYLSYDAFPPPRQEPFSFDGWRLSDKPLVRDRLVFNWHNFLSGCSTWNLEHWKSWITQSQKMGYNAVMVHAYGNNPMVSFTFNGKTKPVGYLSTTVKGRDWSTMHASDVRRLWGGQVFNGPVFGAEAAIVPDDQRADAARKLMHDVFAYAGQRAMDVYFADDVDTPSANPQELIRALPEDARFSIQTKAIAWMGQEAGRMWLANPDTPEGFRYYKAQVESLLAAYPDITTLVVWFRVEGTPWMQMKLDELPPAWQAEYQAELAKTPDAAKLWKSHNVFAVGKIVRAFDRALKELGRQRVQLAAGTWRFDFLPSCDRFFPPQVKLIGLDYEVLHDKAQLRDAESRKVFRDLSRGRQVIPVIWAHHDDGNYIGRPYTPFADFHAKLADARACGFGIIHWTTRPLDLFFTSHAKQVWQSTKDQPLRTTCDEMAARSFGAASGKRLGEYLERWVTDAPKFGRDTSDYFIDRPLLGIDEIVSGCRQRLKLLEAVDVTALPPEQRDRVDYFKGLEEFIAAFHRTHETFQNAQALLKENKPADARATMAGCRPEAVIEQYSKLNCLGGITRGEQGLVVSMNLRWLPYFARLRQMLGMEPVRYNFGPTSHDPLAQAPGKFTFHFDAEHHVWQTLGAAETGAATFVLPAGGEEICRRGIETDQPLTLTLRPILHKAALPPGEYRLRLWTVDPTSTAPGQRVFDVSLGGSVDRVDIFQATGGPNRVLQRTYRVKLERPGEVQVTLTPVQGKAIVCGMILN